MEDDFGTSPEFNMARIHRRRESASESMDPRLPREPGYASNRESADGRESSSNPVEPLLPLTRSRALDSHLVGGGVNSRSGGGVGESVFMGPDGAPIVPIGDSDAEVKQKYENCLKAVKALYEDRLSRATNEAEKEAAKRVYELGKLRCRIQGLLGEDEFGKVIDTIRRSLGKQLYPPDKAGGDSIPMPKVEFKRAVDRTIDDWGKYKADHQDEDGLPISEELDCDYIIKVTDSTFKQVHLSWFNLHYEILLKTNAGDEVRKWYERQICDLFFTEMEAWYFVDGPDFLSNPPIANPPGSSGMGLKLLLKARKFFKCKQPCLLQVAAILEGDVNIQRITRQNLPADEPWSETYGRSPYSNPTSKIHKNARGQWQLDIDCRISYWVLLSGSLTYVLECVRPRR